MFMAIEYQHITHMFKSGNRTWDQMQSIVGDRHRKVKDQTSLFFTFNFYHDLESIFWVYAWFLHHYIPTKAHDHARNHDDVSHSAHTFIYCNIKGNSDRDSLLLDQDKLLAMIDMLTEVYSQTVAPLIDPIVIGSRIALGYKALERTEPVQVDGKPHHWDANNFSKEVYNDIVQAFENVLSYIDKEHGGSVLATAIDFSNGNATGKSQQSEGQKEGDGQNEDVQNEDGQKKGRAQKQGTSQGNDQKPAPKRAKRSGRK
ncbi:hypothetical protein H0H87_001354 [Tephrocybe sp. NHM501043]|nr:hypothetical protein H0H87_001354 [Tephrocybe sp. NHM501043]